MERDLLGLDLSILDLDLVARQHNRNVLADARQVAVPVRHVLVRDSARNIKHDDGALALDVVAVPKTAKTAARRVPTLFLGPPCPHIKFDRAAVRVK